VRPFGEEKLKPVFSMILSKETTGSMLFPTSKTEEEGAA
jgi:hypothetical protein